MPGMLRVSFGLYNTTLEVDALVEGMQAIQAGPYQGVYHQEADSGEFSPEGWQPDFEDYFNFKQAVLRPEDMI